MQEVKSFFITKRRLQNFKVFDELLNVPDMNAEEEFFDALEPQTGINDLDEIYETPEEKSRCLTELKEWAKNQPHFVNCRLDDNFLLRFLRMRKYRVPLAKQVLDKYLTVKTKYPHCYQRLDINDPNLRDLISKGYIFPLLEKDRDGRTVLFCIAGALDSARHRQSDVFRSYMLTFEALMESENNQKRGVTYIFTQEGFHVGHAFLLGLRDLQKMVHIGEKAIPLRHKKMHWMNVPMYLAALFQFLKTFLSQKLQERIILHYSLDSLHEVFPPKILPKEYGGTIPVSEMTARWIDVLESKRERILALDNMRVDESKRIKDRGYFLPRLVSNWTRMELC